VNDNLAQRFVNTHLADLIRRGGIDGAQVLEAVGALGLLHDAVNSSSELSPELDRAATVLVQRIFATYKDSQQSAAALVGFHLRQAFSHNPGLKLLRALLIDEVAKLQKSGDRRAKDASAFLGLATDAAVPYPARQVGQDLLSVFASRAKWQ